MDAKRPNILWISLEDTSPRFGCYGDALARTPHIDRLAEQGALYSRAFAVAGVCSPSRSAVLTGMYPTSIGAHHMRTEHVNPYTPELPTPYEAVPPAYVKAFTEYLRADGYFCSNNWKTDYQFASPLTAWDEDGREAHWRHREPGQPFFAVFNHMHTHESAMWGDMLRQAFDPGREDVTRSVDPALVDLPPYIPDTPKCRDALAKYYDLIAEADDYVGKLLGQLEEDGLADDTIVFLWSDHGEGLPRAKRWPYDAGIRVPLIVRWPGRVPAGTESERLVSLLDLAPTVLSIAGAPVPRHLAGRPFLGPEEAEPREYVFATRDRYDEAYDMVRAVRDSRFKYIRNYHPENPYLQWIKFSHQHPMFQELWRLELAGELPEEQRLLLRNRRPAEELYDCDADPYEVNNLAGDPAFSGVLERLRGALDVWRDRYDVWGDVPEERMVALMRPGGEQPQTASPLFVPINGDVPGIVPSSAGTYAEPTAVLIHSATQGASIAYTTDSGENPRWKLYAGPIVLREGTTRLRAKAVRIGYRISEESAAVYTIANAEK